MVFIENDPQIFNFKDVDQSLTGILINVQEDVGENKSNMYTVESVSTKDVEPGKPVNFWGSTILDQRMIGIKKGDLIKVIYKGLGEAKGGRNAPKIFQVLKDDGTENNTEESVKPQPSA